MAARRGLHDAAGRDGAVGEPTFGARRLAARDRLGIPHALVAPYLVLAVVLGPLALLLYLLLRMFWAGRWTIVEGASRAARRPALESGTAG